MALGLSIESAKQFLGSDFEQYRQTLNTALHTDEPFLETINNYVLGSRGKEIRPVLSLLTSRCCGSLSFEGYCVAAATEMLHTATLMHDDVADGASFRRGALSVAAMFSVPAAVLTGDFWLARSLNVINTNCGREIIRNFDLAIQTMSESELLQLDKAGSLDTTEKDYLKIIYGKTAALFVASLRSAAIVSGASEAAVAAVEAYAKNLGLAFQIRDDILDYSPGLDTGKTAGADLRERKITLPLICALDNYPEKASEVISKIGMIESVLGQKTTEKEELVIAEVTDFVLNGGGLEGATQKLQSYTDAAIQAISALPASQARSMLEGFAEFAGTRGR